MTVQEAIKTRRSIRKFRQQPVAEEILRGLVDGARLAPCSANMQELKYKIVDFEHTGTVYPFLNWAVAITPAGIPKEDERPAAYIILAADTSVRPKNTDIDVGIAAQTIALAAWEKGIGSCLLALHDKPGIQAALALPDAIVPALAVALGYPAHSSEVVPMENGEYRYTMTPDGNFHVPKRSLEEVLL